MKPKLLTPYQLAERWQFAHIFAADAERATRNQILPDAKIALDNLSKALDTIMRHKTAEVIEAAKIKTG